MSPSSGPACPECGREDQVRGRADAESADVELTCGRCKTSWWRGARRCATCGGQDLTSSPQVMRRHSRGTQLSIIGWRDVVLCQTCDGEVLESAGATGAPIDEDYVSAALIDRRAPSPAARPSARESGARPAGPRTAASDTRTGASRPQPAKVASTARAKISPRPGPPAAPVTVRQALEQSQEQLALDSTVLNPTVVLVLGTWLGPATRLDALERSGHDPAAVAVWVRSTWGLGGAEAAALHTLFTLADHWLARGWTTTDLAAALRPQENA